MSDNKVKTASDIKADESKSQPSEDLRRAEAERKDTDTNGDKDEGEEDQQEKTASSVGNKNTTESHADGSVQGDAPNTYKDAGDLEAKQ